MLCKQCGAEIADKALICYRCGAATSEAKHKPYVARGRSSRLGLAVSFLTIVLLALLALYMGRVTTGEVPRAIGWAAAAIAAAVLGLRIFMRRAR